MTTWGPSFKGTGSPPEGYVQGTPVQFLSKTGMGWTSTKFVVWSTQFEYRLPADHPYYGTPEEAAVKLLTELGYTGITPPDLFQKDRDFVADMFESVGSPASARLTRQGRLEQTAKKYMTFIRENKERI